MGEMVDKQHEFLNNIALLLLMADKLGFKATAGEAYRTQYQQDEHKRNGLSKVSRSNHQDRLAMDFNFFREGQYINGLNRDEAKLILEPLGAYWEGLHEDNVWGGHYKTFTDVPHFERR